MAMHDAAFGRLWVLNPAREQDWDALYAEQLPRVYNFFRYRVGDGTVAEDLTSLTFEKAWVARQRYRRDLGAFSTWLMTIARNVATDYYRRRRDHAPLERDRDLVSLKYGAGLTNRVIARHMKLTETNVGTLLHRAVQKLRAGWQQEGA